MWRLAVWVIYCLRSALATWVSLWFGSSAYMSQVVMMCVKSVGGKEKVRWMRWLVRWLTESCLPWGVL